MDGEIVLAHLTDPHLDFGAPRGREFLSKRALSWLNWRLKRRAIQRADLCAMIVADIHAHAPDLIAMTGDLVNFAVAEEFRRARAWLDRLGPPERVAAVPGNHEAIAPGMTRALHAAWGPYLTGPDGRPGYPWRRDVGPVSIVGVSTAAASLPFLATGVVGPGQRERLDAMLGAITAEGRLAVILIHHPPTPITNRRKGLTDGALVCEVIARRGAGLVLHGHTHRAELSWIDGPAGRIPVLGAPSASWEPGPGRAGAAWRRLRLRSALDAWHLTLEERCATPGGIVARTPLAFRLPLPGAAAPAPLVSGTSAARMPPDAAGGTA
ncbi:metallophosphoesterase [Limibaculum sp. FT325]|uniref:metallophosphoesterase family protein n=1 Tax=Thermohalobaculum sediminis TaxID=2939436 RepID=UPI0020BF09DF|nr:metallophosphoesterase [Limibaculum sediminis]MCL5775971.1 metallophosphoesterase [Limibaculum sediminis]